MKSLILAGRLVFGAWILINGANYLFLSLWPMPSGHEPLAIQLMAALVHSRLLAVAMTVQLVTGALLLAGIFVPVALCVVMPVSTCALFWSAVLDHQPLGALLALLAFALNGLLMLAYIDYYKGALERQPPMAGEPSNHRGSFDSLLVNPGGRTSRSQFVPAVITLAVVAAFYAYFVPGRSGQWSMLMLMYPGIVLHVRRLHDMGPSAWLLAIPGILAIAGFAIWLHLLSLGAQLDTIVPPAAIVVSVAFAVWGCIGKGQAEANSFGAPVEA
ncbi:MAG TPA: DUF805 domain-containing protein [Steroidobacteraceae bacterium]|jgi:uncharacterized membrane protein YhaH (DUF805 family)